MQKIVHIIYSGLGGHFSVVQSLIEADSERKYNHCIFFYGIEELPPAYIEKCKSAQIDFVFIKKKPGADIASLKQLVRHLKSRKPDVILLNSVNLILTVFRYKMRRKVKLIAIEHQTNELKTKREWIWSLLIMRMANKVVYLTDRYKEQMQRKLRYLFVPAKVTVINNGINTLLFKPGEKRKENKEINIGMLSRLTSIKDHKTLLQAFKMTCTHYAQAMVLRLFIAGDGETKTSLQQLANELQINDKVSFTGMLNENESAAFLNDLDIYVHASYGETMSTAIMQAMACAKPVVASDVDGINNMIRDRDTGLLVPLENAERMMAAFRMLIDNNILRKELGTAAHDYATAHFSNTGMFKKYEALFK